MRYQVCECVFDVRLDSEIGRYERVEADAEWDAEDANWDAVLCEPGGVE